MLLFSPDVLNFRFKNSMLNGQTLVRYALNYHSATGNMRFHKPSVAQVM